MDFLNGGAPKQLSKGRRYLSYGITTVTVGNIDVFSIKLRVLTQFLRVYHKTLLELGFNLVVYDKYTLLSYQSISSMDFTTKKAALAIVLELYSIAKVKHKYSKWK